MDIYLYLNDQQCGPYSDAQLRTMLATGSISPTDLAWREGLPGWQPLNTVISVGRVAPPPPPRPPAPPSPQKLKRGLIRCKACGNPVSKQAKACPSCGAPIKRRSGCGGCLGLAVVLVIAGAIAQQVANVSPSPSAPPPAPVVTAPPPSSLPQPVRAATNPAQAPAAQPPAATNAAAPSAPAAAPAPEQWTTTDGKTYKNVTVLSHDAQTVTIDSTDGAATFPIATLSKDTQKRVLADNVTSTDWTVNGKTFRNVKVGTVDSDAVHITYDGGVGTVALADLPPDLQKKFKYDPNQAPTVEGANALIGLTEAQVIAKLGQPIRVKKDDSPDGPFEQLVFNDSQDKATFCFIFEKDGTTDGVFYPGGTVSNGSYRGLLFPTKTPEQAAADKAQADADRPKREVAAFKAALTRAGIDNSIIESFSVQGNDLTIVVTTQYNLVDYQTRLQAAQNFEKLWTVIHGDNAFLSLTDHNGNEVGGTGLMGVWVQKEQ